MEIDLGADIIGSDGEKLGVVDSLVMDPTTGAIRSIVIRKGMFFPTDRIVPAERVASAEHGRVTLSISQAEADQLTEYMDAEYMMPPAGFYGAGGYIWPSTTIYNSDVMVDEQIHERQPNAVILSEGTMVVDETGDELGRITEIHSDDQGRVAGFRVEEGIFRHHEHYIPAHFIATADDNIVCLSVSRDGLEQATGPKGR